MCGRLNVIDDPMVQEICDNLGIKLWPAARIYGRFLRPTQSISIVREQHGVRQMNNAIWWLLLEATDDGFKPSKYTSFNTRSDKLNIKRSAGYQAYRQSRCVVPVTGFGETLSMPGQAPRYTDMTGKDGGLLLGGLCRSWHHPKLAEPVLSCSIITLPPHPKLMHIHSKAMPLILPQDQGLLDSWLSEEVTDIENFSPLLAPHIPQDLITQEIDKPSTYNALSDPGFIEKD
ncbi:SOS response-associated peptidase family protein [Aliiglaciecola sp. CAU 1673]|uniref:SOS response-associated peptidase family protein n=1 Tax=Aliiglaciecola sp. CAU 1673 TaxID=3032595 RepID=UPI0023DB8F70|nr:SOS response-associated peptidase family protein [Aliiglaciecola sp. CAU 1673]MDF2179974.1 SOS response-associated peptidase family protein [Aliiglaciecola sp. CAU 1673]